MADMLVRGQKLDLSAQTTASRLHVLVETSGSAEATVRCLGLGKNEKVLEPAYLIHPPQPRSPSAAIVLSPESAQRTDLMLTLDDLPDTLHKLVVTIDVERGSFAQLDQATIRLGDESREIARFDLRAALTSSEAERAKAAVAIELYRRDGWRLAAVGQGFAGGLPSLLHQFGATDAFNVARTSSSPATPPAPPVDTTRPVQNTSAAASVSSSSSSSSSQTDAAEPSPPTSSQTSSGSNTPNIPTNLDDTPLGVQVAGAGAVTLFGFIFLATPLAILVFLGAVYFTTSRVAKALIANAERDAAERGASQQRERTVNDPPSSKN